MDWHTWLAFFIACWIIAVSPGSGAVLSMSHGLSYGVRKTSATILGLQLGLMLILVIAGAGVGSLLMASEWAFNLVKIVGACYLIYLGIRAFMAKPGVTTRKDLPTVTSTQAYFQAVGAEVLNPKTAIFFLAFLPQFIHPESGSSLAQFAVLGLIFSGLSAMYTTLISLAIRPLSQWMVGLSRLRRWEGKIIGTLFMGLGLKIAFQQR